MYWSCTVGSNEPNLRLSQVVTILEYGDIQGKKKTQKTKEEEDRKERRELLQATRKGNF